MKTKKITLIATLCIAKLGICQIYTPSGIVNGPSGSTTNVGIGTGASVIPNAKLEILSTTNQFRLSNTASIFNDFNTNASGYLTVMPSNATTSRIGFNTTTPLTGFHINMGTLRLSDPASTTRAFQVTPSYPGNGDIPAGTLVMGASTTANEGLSFIPSGSGTSGVKLGAYAYNGSWKSMWETSNTGSFGSMPNLLLVKNGGNVGIGTGLTVPTSKLEINANSGNTKAISIKNSINNEVFYIACDGRTIINTQPTPSGFPASGLQINQNFSSGGGIGLDVKLTDPNNAYAINTNLTVKTDNQTAIQVINETYFTGANTRFQVKGNGATYIGAKVAFGNHNDALLSVYGKALFKSIYVNTSSAVWADYVFEKNYKLTPLTEVESYYKINKHLIDFKSAKEYETEGVNVVETQALLLKKIEELTLYIVELDKQVKQLQQSKK